MPQPRLNADILLQDQLFKRPSIVYYHLTSTLDVTVMAEETKR